MKKIVGILSLSLLLASCGEKKEEKKGGFEMNRTKTEKKATETSVEIPVDMDNQGVGPYKNIEFPTTIDKDLAAKGEIKYNTVCTACHMPNKRMIGPALSGVYERRSAAWVMNMLKNPDGMLKEDPIAIALLAEYNNAVMINNNLTDEETRAVAEYLRTL